MGLLEARRVLLMKQARKAGLIPDHASVAAYARWDEVEEILRAMDRKILRLRTAVQAGTVEPDVDDGGY